MGIWFRKRGSDGKEAHPVEIRGLPYLLLLTERPKHGYALLDELSQRTGGKLELGPSSLYYTLGRLEDAGLIHEVESDSDEPHDAQRRYYELTAPGREQLADFVVTLEEVIRQARAAGFEPGRTG